MGRNRIFLYNFPKVIYSLKSYHQLRLQDITVSYVHLCEDYYCQATGLFDLSRRQKASYEKKYTVKQDVH